MPTASESQPPLERYIETCQSDHVIAASATAEAIMVSAAVSGLPTLVGFLKSDPRLQMRTLIDITAIDRPGEEKRFTLVYQFLSMSLNLRLQLKASLRDGETAPSILSVHPSANWYEREVFDMYGILFTGHPDMRRILTDYGFQGHPLRKDFPVSGYTELRYDEERKEVIYEPVNLVQEFRQFDFLSPWEGKAMPQPEGEDAGLAHADGKPGGAE